MKRRYVLLTALSALLLLVVPTALAQTDPTASLTGTQWQLVSYGLPGAETSVLPGSNVTLTFESANQLGGHGGCNSYGGQYLIDNNQLVVSEVVSTLMACADEEVTNQERVYLDALRAAGQYALSEDRLFIQYGAGEQLIFERSGQAPPPDQGQQPPDAFEDLRSPVSLLASYYNAINLQDYQRAYSYWENPPDPFDQFAAGFADTASVQVIVQPPTRYSGAAGSLYVETPTVLIADHFDGAQLMYVGCFVTRTSNLQPPDIPEEDVWHLYSADVTEVPTDSSIPALLAEACPEG